MSPDDTKVLIGGRRLRKIPTQTQVFVENEDPYHGSIRHRRTATSFTTSTPTNMSTPAYSNPDYFTPNSHKNQVEYVHHDSGFYGSSSNSRTNIHDGSSKAGLLESFTKPVLNRIGKLRGGRSTFFEEERSRVWSVQPQKVLGCLVFVTVLSSLGFAILITINHFGREANVSLNGKYQSMKYAAGKINNVGKENSEKSSNEEVTNPPFTYDEAFDNVNESLKAGYDPFFDVLNVIGEMSDLVLSEKIEELENKIKSKKIKIQRIKPSEDAFGDLISEDLGEELLTQRPNYRTTKHAPFEELLVEDIVNEKMESTKLIEIVEKINDENLKAQEEVSTSALVTNKRKKSKLVNPLLKYVPVKKVSKVKISKDKKSNLDEVMDYPDDPTFRGIVTKMEAVDQN